MRAFHGDDEDVDGCHHHSSFIAGWKGYVFEKYKKDVYFLKSTTAIVHTKAHQSIKSFYYQDYVWIKNEQIGKCKKNWSFPNHFEQKIS